MSDAPRPGVRRYSALHLFCGSGGGALGFKEAGFALAGAIDIDPRCAIDFAALVGETAIVADIETMSPAELGRLVPVCPDVVFLSAPCDGFSGCNSEAKARTEKYQRLNRLALHGVRLAVMAWGRQKPRAILFENVPRITTRGKDLLAQITLELAKAGYRVDQRLHDCGEIGGLAQSRKRFLLLARDPATLCEPIRKPVSQRMRSIGEVIAEYPVPRPYSRGDSMHVLQPLSPLNHLRLACIRAGGDWRTLPESVELVVCATEEIGRLNGVAWGPCRGIGHADPRVPWDPSKHKGRPGHYGVANPQEPSITVRGRHEIQNCEATVPDPRVARVAIEYQERNGAYEVQAAGVPSKTVLGHFEVRQAPGAVEDRRVAGGAGRSAQGKRQRTRAEELRHALSFDEQGWVIPTHKLARHADGRFLLFGPALDFSARAATVHLCIEAADGTWHRALTMRELATLQSVPRSFVYCGPRTSTKTGTGQAKRNGNMVPRLAALRIAEQVLAALIASDSGQLSLMAAGGVWVRPLEATDGAQTGGASC